MNRRTGHGVRLLAAASVGLSAVVAIAACGASNDGSPAPPLTLAERCSFRCAPPTDDEHPCTGAHAEAACQPACESSLAGKSSDCADCVLATSGWRGTTCSCATSPVFGSIGCTECDYTGSGKGCGVQLIDKCTDGQKTCAGFVATAVNDPQCAAKCGVTPDSGSPERTRCESACAPPSDPNNPCSQAAQAQVGACVATCTTRLSGKSDACATCYLSHSPWLGESCSCTGGTCTGCNWYGNAAGSEKACGPTSCSSGTACRGFQDIGLDDPTCASLCGAPLPEAGPDGAPDANESDAADASTDG